VLAGKDTAGRLVAGMRAMDTPVVLAGYSRGACATARAMHKNFVEDCDRDVPDGGCRPALARPNTKEGDPVWPELGRPGLPGGRA